MLAVIPVSDFCLHQKINIFTVPTISFWTHTFHTGWPILAQLEYGSDLTHDVSNMYILVIYHSNLSKLLLFDVVVVLFLCKQILSNKLASEIYDGINFAVSSCPAQDMGLWVHYDLWYLCRLIILLKYWATEITPHPTPNFSFFFLSGSARVLQFLLWCVFKRWSQSVPWVLL